MVLSEYLSEATGGHLWWTRWAPYQEIPSVTIVLFDGWRTDDCWVHQSELAAELDHWAHDRMPLLGELLTTRWLGPSGSLKMMRSRFGVQGFDEVGQVVWSEAAEAAGEPEVQQRARRRSARPRRAR